MDSGAWDNIYIERLLPENRSIYINNLSFSYPGTEEKCVLDNVSLTIPENQVTAIVGLSGSGKTTLLKLLLKFYAPVGGEIIVGNTDLSNIASSTWRDNCGVVLQDSYLFSNTIANNIALGDENPNWNRIWEAVRIASIEPFIKSLPLGLNTTIGADGSGLSQGQKQRILIARAVYKSPHYIFFDEATNSLDANNEHEIICNLDKFFKNRTVIIVAHRLSTVRNADNIIVMDMGRIVEFGTHETLVGQSGRYFQLVKNQLELGN